VTCSRLGGATLKRLIIFVALVIAASISLTAKAPAASAQSCETAAAPDCPYGYYDSPPYTCAPYNYYGPEWFPSSIFVGAGPWFNGSDKFHGSVDNRLDPQHGYKGPNPNRGEKRDASKKPDKNPEFKGNEVRDGRGHIVEDKK
jgi:hypothetical protein